MGTATSARLISPAGPGTRSGVTANTVTPPVGMPAHTTSEYLHQKLFQDADIYAELFAQYVVWRGVKVVRV
ncbi:MAG TPA: hypothetical protein VFO85_10975, partial [Vicinamibacteria bacterium]|nr:hypothetical protein [Vicinamibacteria bacterium]